MAIYHCSAQIISKSEGRSVVAAVAYRSGTKIENERTGIVHDFRKKSDVHYSEIMLPTNAPNRFRDRSILWNEVERIEKAKDSQLAREIEFSIPKELPMHQWIPFAQNTISAILVERGIPADFSIHYKINERGEIHNAHVHVTSPLRPLDEDGKWQNKTEQLYICKNAEGEEQEFTKDELALPENIEWKKQHHYSLNGDPKEKKIYLSEYDIQNNPKYSEYRRIKGDRQPKTAKYGRKNPNVELWSSVEFLQLIRKEVADHINDALAELGIDERVDHRSFAEQGIDREPTIHIGVAATAMERRGIATDRGDINREIEDKNEELRVVQNNILVAEANEELLKKEIEEEAKQLYEDRIHNDIQKEKERQLYQVQDLGDSFFRDNWVNSHTKKPYHVSRTVLWDEHGRKRSVIELLFILAMVVITGEADRWMPKRVPKEKSNDRFFAPTNRKIQSMIDSMYFAKQENLYTLEDINAKIKETGIELSRAKKGLTNTLEAKEKMDPLAVMIKDYKIYGPLVAKIRALPEGDEKEKIIEQYKDIIEDFESAQKSMIAFGVVTEEQIMDFERRYTKINDDIQAQKNHITSTKKMYGKLQRLKTEQYLAQNAQYCYGPLYEPAKKDIVVAVEPEEKYPLNTILAAHRDYFSELAPCYHYGRSIKYNQDTIDKAERLRIAVDTVGNAFCVLRDAQDQLNAMPPKPKRGLIPVLHGQERSQWQERYDSLQECCKDQCERIHEGYIVINDYLSKNDMVIDLREDGKYIRWTENPMPDYANLKHSHYPYKVAEEYLQELEKEAHIEQQKKKLVESAPKDNPGRRIAALEHLQKELLKVPFEERERVLEALETQNEQLKTEVPREQGGEMAAISINRMMQDRLSPSKRNNQIEKQKKKNQGYGED